MLHSSVMGLLSVLLLVWACARCMIALLKFGDQKTTPWRMGNFIVINFYIALYSVAYHCCKHTVSI